MSLLSFYFDLTSKKLVGNVNDSRTVTLPDLHQEDGLNLDLYVLERSSFAVAPFFAYKSIQNLSLFLSIGSANNVLASQSSFTKDSENQKFTGTLELNTAGINALGANDTTCCLELRLLDATSGAYYRGQFPVKIVKSVALAAAVVTPATGVPLTVLEAAQLYLPYELPAGRGITLVSQDGLVKRLLYLDNDGELRWPTLT